MTLESTAQPVSPRASASRPSVCTRARAALRVGEAMEVRSPPGPSRVGLGPEAVDARVTDVEARLLVEAVRGPSRLEKGDVVPLCAPRPWPACRRRRGRLAHCPRRGPG